MSDNPDTKCSFCKKKFNEFPFTCKFCGRDFCSEHRLPENHECPGLEKYKENQKESLSSKKPAQPIEYFYHRDTTPKKKKRPKTPYAIIAVGIIIMASALITSQTPLYYIGFIIILAGLIKLFMPDYQA